MNYGWPLATLLQFDGVPAPAQQYLISTCGQLQHKYFHAINKNWASHPFFYQSCREPEIQKHQIPLIIIRHVWTALWTLAVERAVWILVRVVTPTTDVIDVVTIIWVEAIKHFGPRTTFIDEKIEKSKNLKIWKIWKFWKFSIFRFFDFFLKCESVTIPQPTAVGRYRALSSKSER